MKKCPEHFLLKEKTIRNFEQKSKIIEISAKTLIKSIRKPPKISKNRFLVRVGAFSAPCRAQVGSREAYLGRRGDLLLLFG